MTRDEAVYAIHKAHNPDDFEEAPPQHKWDSHRDWAIKAVDGYVALGLLKLDPPLTIEQRINRAINMMGSRRDAGDVKEALAKAGFKIVEA